MITYNDETDRQIIYKTLRDIPKEVQVRNEILIDLRTNFLLYKLNFGINLSNYIKNLLMICVDVICIYFTIFILKINHINVI